MFLTRRSLSRRTFLRDRRRLDRAAAARRDDSCRHRAGADRRGCASRARLPLFPARRVMENWTPATAGADFALSPILKPLAPLRKHLTVVSNIDNKPAESRAVACARARHLAVVRASAGGLDALRRRDGRPGGRRNASARRPPGRRSRSRLRRGRAAGAACERGYGCSYTQHASRSARRSTPLPIESNPRKLFLRLFGQGDSADERARSSRSRPAACSTW